MPETQKYMCGIGEFEAVDDGHTIIFIWRVHNSFISAFAQMTSRWCDCREGRFKLLKFNEENIHLGLMKENPTVPYRVRMGLMKSASQEIFCVSGQMPPTTSLHKERLCSLEDFDREFGHSMYVSFFCEIQKNGNIEVIPEGTEENSGANKGTSTEDIGENAEGASRKLTGTRPKEINTRPKQVYSDETIKATGAETRERIQNVTECKRNTGKRIFKDMRSLLREEYKTDLVFKLKDGTLKAHEAILWARIPYVQSMLQKMIEGTISYPDYTVAGFRVFLDFIYTSEVDLINSSNVFEVFFISRDFGDQCLTAECLEILSSSISLSNFVRVMELQLICKCEELQKAIFRFFVRNKERIAEAENFASFNDAHPEEINALFLRELNNS